MLKHKTFLIYSRNLTSSTAKNVRCVDLQTICSFTVSVCNPELSHIPLPEKVQINLVSWITGKIEDLRAGAIQWQRKSILASQITMSECTDSYRD